MATEKLTSTDTIPATADLRTAQYKLITLAGALAGAGVACYPLQDKPNTGQNASIGTGGVSKVVYGATVVAGALLASNAAGLAITATVGQRVVGTARTAGVNGEVGSMHIGGGIA